MSPYLHLCGCARFNNGAASRLSVIGLICSVGRRTKGAGKNKGISVLGVLKWTTGPCKRKSETGIRMRTANAPVASGAVGQF